MAVSKFTTPVNGAQSACAPSKPGTLPDDTAPALNTNNGAPGYGWKHRAAELSKLAHAKLVNRSEIWGYYLPLHKRTPGEPPGRTANSKDKQLIDPDLRLSPGQLARHFCGLKLKDLIGLHTTSVAGACMWLVLDIDAHTTSDDSDANLRLALLACERLRSLGFTPALEDSNGAGGFHVWVLFASPRPSRDVHALGKWAVRDHGLSKDPEVYPKQADLDPTKYPNWMRVPGRHHTREHWSRFYDFATGEWASEAEAADLFLAFLRGGDPAPIPDEHEGVPLPRLASKKARAAREADPAVEAKVRQAKALSGARSPVARAKAWLLKRPGAVEGQGGGTATLATFVAMLANFGHGDDEADRAFLLEAFADWNRTCDPPWDPDDPKLEHKLDDALESVPPSERGKLLAVDRPKSTFKVGTNGTSLNGDGRHDNGDGDGDGGEGDDEEGVPALRAGGRVGRMVVDDEDDEAGAVGAGAIGGGAGPVPNEAPHDPHRLARHYRDLNAHGGLPTVRFWRGNWHEWDGSCYQIIPDSEQKGKISRVVKREMDLVNLKEIDEWGRGPGRTKTGVPIPMPVARPVTVPLVGNVVAALASYCQCESRLDQPAWLGGDPPFPLAESVNCRNGLIHLPSFLAGEPVYSVAPTPLLFTPNAVDYDFDPRAPEPVEWLRFLDSVWPGDAEAVATLRQWFGYCLTPDTSQQKIVFLCGPTRCGKGTIGRTLTQVVGVRNTIGPNLKSFTTNFGLAPMVSKSLAVVGDVRLSGKEDQAPIIERLLSISGEDLMSFDQKNRDYWHGRLPTRLMLLGNEPPKFTDASNALVGRMLVLTMRESFKGREDKGLEAKLKAELPGILLWAIEGWRSLRERGRFLEPASSRELVDEMGTMASPVAAFVEDVAEVGDNYRVDTQVLFEEWQLWCETQGRDYPGTAPAFGSNLRSVLPKLTTTKTRRGNVNVRYYNGLRLQPGAAAVRAKRLASLGRRDPQDDPKP